MEKFNTVTKTTLEGDPIAIRFSYSESAAKVRSLKEKQFYSVGEMSDATLFGRQVFSPGSSRCITVTEGELDAMSVWQMLDGRFPCVSVRSASSARRDMAKEFDFLNSFDKIYLCFDSDEPGQTAVKEVAGLFDFNKVYHVKLGEGFKDANDYLTNGQGLTFRNVWYNARRFIPDDILSQFNEYDSLLESEANVSSVPYPFERLQAMSYGIRRGECHLFTAQEGIGKTEVIRHILYHLLQVTDDNVAAIFLEESKQRTLKGLASYTLGIPAHLPDSNVSMEEIKRAYKEAIKRDERLYLYNHFGSSDPMIILDMIRFMVSVCNCKYVFLDHITMVVSGLEEDNERKALDMISTRLAMMAQELDFALIFVSHVNDEDKTRGSRNISKIADLHVHLSRDITHPDPSKRNTTELTVKKNRFAGTTGPSSKLMFDPVTFRLHEIVKRELPPASEGEQRDA
jgi:twinkle protein